MAEAAAHLVDHVLPHVPVRQWVLSMPWRLRYLLACDVELCNAVRRCLLRAVFDHYRERAERAGLARGRTGAVNALQRFGSATRSSSMASTPPRARSRVPSSTRPSDSRTRR